MPPIFHLPVQRHSVQFQTEARQGEMVTPTDHNLKVIDETEMNDFQTTIVEVATELHLFTWNPVALQTRREVTKLVEGIKLNEDVIREVVTKEDRRGGQQAAPPLFLPSSQQRRPFSNRFSNHPSLVDDQRNGQQTRQFPQDQQHN
ncbi:hypothetical protein BLNAU_6921 [Blattamonas nauphoetae]|uniref:Uncharacterized protein n=1 Tax=Blattamonas nauphoetae TaxID=2049346 RepID=A0ABQ9Y2P6_9EUKA|nr:hypothetical protein BLNAU_6921 [Blattamonas nauphoetae]